MKTCSPAHRPLHQHHIRSLAGFSCRVGALLAAATSHLPPLAPEPAPTGAMLRSGTSVFLCPLPYHRRHRVPSTLYHTSPPRSTHSPATTTTTYHTRPPPAATTHSPPPLAPLPPLPSPLPPPHSHRAARNVHHHRLASQATYNTRVGKDPTKVGPLPDPLRLEPCRTRSNWCHAALRH